MFMSIVLWTKRPFVLILGYIGLFGTSLYLGRAPSTKETLPDFCERCQVTRHSRVFRQLMGSQRTPREWDVTLGGSDMDL